MKKVFALLLTAALLLALAACGTKAPTNDSDASVSEQPTEAVETVSDPLELLETVWASYTEDEKFPSAGGDMTEENMRDGAPGVYGIADASEVDRVLGYPAAEISKIDSAASMVHMMNLNTFTAGAYHVVSGTDTAALASAIEKNIQSRQWMCGFPDKLIVVSAGSCLVSAFGAEDLVNTFRDKIVAAYADAQVLVDAPIDV